MKEPFLQLMIERLRPLLGPAGQAGLDMAQKNLDYLKTLPDTPAHFAVWRSTVEQAITHALLAAVLMATEPPAPTDHLLG